MKEGERAHAQACPMQVQKWKILQNDQKQAAQQQSTAFVTLVQHNKQHNKKYRSVTFTWMVTL